MGGKMKKLPIQSRQPCSNIVEQKPENATAKRQEAFAGEPIHFCELQNILHCGQTNIFNPAL